MAEVEDFKQKIKEAMNAALTPLITPFSSTLLASYVNDEGVAVLDADAFRALAETYFPEVDVDLLLAIARRESN